MSRRFLFVLAIALGVNAAHGQSLGDIARANREKQNSATPAANQLAVITSDDLEAGSDGKAAQHPAAKIRRSPFTLVRSRMRSIRKRRRGGRNRSSRRKIRSPLCRGRLTRSTRRCIQRAAPSSTGLTTNTRLRKCNAWRMCNCKWTSKRRSWRRCRRKRAAPACTPRCTIRRKNARNEYGRNRYCGSGQPHTNLAN